MTITYAPKKLAFVKLADSKADVYDSGVTVGLIHNIILHNSNASPEVVVLYLHDGTNEYKILSNSLAVDETYILQFTNEGLVVDASSKITGSTTTSAKVTCLICGTEVS